MHHITYQVKMYMILEFPFWSVSTARSLAQSWVFSQVFGTTWKKGTDRQTDYMMHAQKLTSYVTDIVVWGLVGGVGALTECRPHCVFVDATPLLTDQWSTCETHDIWYTYTQQTCSVYLFDRSRGRFRKWVQHELVMPAPWNMEIEQTYVNYYKALALNWDCFELCWNTITKDIGFGDTCAGELAPKTLWIHLFFLRNE